MILNFYHQGSTYASMTPADAISAGVPQDVVLNALAGALGQKIDAAAGKARQSFVSAGELIEQEYTLAKRESQEWLDAGADTASVPTCVQDHADAFGVTVTEAANEIVAMGNAWEQAMRDIRTLRLSGKAAVRKADTIEGAEQAANDAIAQLKAYRP